MPSKLLQVYERFRHQYSPELYGTFGDGLDSTAAIQAAIDAAGAAGGGEVLLPEAIYLISSTLVLNARGVRLIGQGAAGNFDNGAIYGTVLKWTGAADGTMVRMTAVSGGSNYPMSHGGLVNVSLDCQGVADKGLELLSVREGVFEDIFIRNPDVVGIDMNVVASLAVARDNQQCVFDRITIRCAESGGTNAIGIRLDGDGVANTSYNHFRAVQIQHVDGIGIQLKDADSNVFHGVLISRPSGTGVGIELNGSATPNASHARYNDFFAVSAGAGGVTAKGAALTQPSAGNAIFGYVMSNSAPYPVVEASATLSVYTDTGEVRSNGQLRLGDPRTTLFIHDDFMRGLGSTGTIGDLGWNLINGTASQIASAIDHPGAYTISSTATANTLATIHMRGGPTLGNLDADEDFDMLWIVRVNVNDAEALYRIGLGNDVSANPPNEGIYIEKLAADTSWFGVTRAASSQNRTAALVAVSTNWITMRIRRVNSTTIGFTVNNAAEVTLAATVPTADLMPFLQVRNAATTAAKTITIDYMSLSITGLAR